MRTPEQAIGWAEAQFAKTDPIWSGRCDGSTGNAYGFAHTGEPTAFAHWLSVRSHAVATTDLSSAPPGAVCFWSDIGAGHAVLSLGGGMCASTDIVVPGCIRPIAISRISQIWGNLKPLGYVIGPQDVMFPHASGTSPVPPLQPVDPTHTYATANGETFTTPGPVPAQTMSVTNTNPMLTAPWWKRAGLMILGVAVLIAGIIFLNRKRIVSTVTSVAKDAAGAAVLA